MIEDILNIIDFSSAFNNLNNLIDTLKVKKFRRKFRKNGSIYYTKYLITFNPVRDLLIDSLSLSLKTLNSKIK